MVAPLIARVGANHFDVFVTESERSEERRLMEAALRDELRIVLLRRGLQARGLKEDLIKRPLRERGAQVLTEEAAVALLFVRRRSGSMMGGLALTDDAGAIEWIVEACKEMSVHYGGRGLSRT